MRQKRKLLAAALGIAAVGAVVTTTGLSAASGPDPVPRTQSGYHVCTTNAAGVCTVRHNLKVKPEGVQLTPNIHPGATQYTLSNVRLTWDADSFNVRAMLARSTPAANRVIYFSWVAFADASTVPPTTQPTTTTTQPPSGMPVNTCTNPVWSTSIDNGNSSMRNFNGYWVHNNHWDAQAGQEQTIHVCSEKSWYVDAMNMAYNNGQVYSYPNVHKDLPNWPVGNDLSTFRTITSTFAGKGPEKGSYNVAYDMWLNDVGWTCGATEVMVWTETYNAPNPLGRDVADYTSPSGRAYDVWHYNDGCMNVVSFKDRATQYAGSLNIKHMLDWAASNGWVRNRTTIDRNPGVAAIDYGIEFRGSAGTARFFVSNFSVTTS